MSNLSTLPKGDSAWLLRKAIERIIQQVSVLETNIGSSTTGNSANTQIIFNDNGTLRGDAGLTYNKTTDLLTVGAATITGDLTVDTSTLKVDSANNRVGIGTASPTQVLTVRGNVLTTAAAGTDSYANVSTDGVQNSYLGFNNSGSTNAAGASNNNTYIGNGNNYGTQIVGNSNILASFGTTGVFNWYDGAGGTRMTLNSTGLGIGVGPSYPFHLRNSASAIGMVHSTNANGPYVIFQNSTANFGDIGSELSITGGGSAGNMTINSRFSSNLCFSVSDTVRMRIDSSGNVGIGVTPSAWAAGYTAIQNRQTAWWSSASRDFHIGANVYYNGTNEIYIGTAQASKYTQYQAAHYWYNASSGTAGNNITFTQAMTLDASGNLLVGTTSNPNSSRAAVKTASVTSALSLNSVTGDTAQELFVINKFDSNSTTSQVFARFTNNNGAAGSGQINGNGANACAFGSFSDARLKENIVSLPSQLANILSLRPVEFDYKDGSGHQIGFVAQEIQEVYADTVAEQNGFLTVTGWSKTEARLVSAIKELAAKVQALEAKLA